MKGFAVRPVMNGDWLYSELSSLSKGKPVSADLYRMAKRAGTTTNRYLLEQLRFYPQLDPNGDCTSVPRAADPHTAAGADGEPGQLAVGGRQYRQLTDGHWPCNCRHHAGVHRWWWLPVQRASP